MSEFPSAGKSIGGRPELTPELMEELAALEHEQWMHWMCWMIPKIREEIRNAPWPIKLRNEVNKSFNSLPCIKRWGRQMITHYENLSEEEKESDRKEVLSKFEKYNKNGVGFTK